MANKALDFNKIKRSFYTVTMKDGKKLLVKMPMKKTFEKISTYQSIADNADGDQAMDALGGICAEILSNNMTGERIIAESITDEYDIEEMYAFINMFMDFVNGVQGDPN